MKKPIQFVAKVTLAHLITYFVVGGIAYQILTKHFYVGQEALFAAFMRTESEPELWSHVMRWFLPVQVLRGVLIGLVLYPFFDTLAGWRRWKRGWTIAALYLVLGFWGAAVAAPGTLEGLVYLRPAFTTAVHLKVQPEIVIQGLAMAAWVARWMAPAPARPITV